MSTAANSASAIIPANDSIDDSAVGSPRRLLWEAMLDADYLSRYYGELGSKYEKYETWLHFATLFLSTGTIVTLLDYFQAQGGGGLWATRVLAMLAAAASLWMRELDAAARWVWTAGRSGWKSPASSSPGRRWSSPV